MLVRALDQARRYFGPGTIPLVVVSELGGAAIACLPLAAFAKLVGLDPSKLPRPRRDRREPRQLALALEVEPGAQR